MGTATLGSNRGTTADVSSFRHLDETASMFERNPDVLLTLYIIVVFIAFTSGFFLGALFSPARERKEYEPWHARLAAAEEKPRHDGKVRSTILPAVVIALVVVSGLIVRPLQGTRRWLRRPNEYST